MQPTALAPTIASPPLPSSWESGSILNPPIPHTPSKKLLLHPCSAVFRTPPPSWWCLRMQTPPPPMQQKNPHCIPLQTSGTQWNKIGKFSMAGARIPLSRGQLRGGAATPPAVMWVIVAQVISLEGASWDHDAAYLTPVKIPHGPPNCMSCAHIN